MPEGHREQKTSGLVAALLCVEQLLDQRGKPREDRPLQECIVQASQVELIDIAEVFESFQGAGRLSRGPGGSLGKR